MQPRLEIEFLSDDPSKIWVKACNEKFAGETEQYINAQWLTELAENLSGFPKSNLDEVVFEAGSESSKNGYCKFKFYCTDSAGHTAILVSISNGISGNETADNQSFAKFKIQFEALSLDTFASSIKLALKSGSGVSELIGIKPYTQNV